MKNIFLAVIFILVLLNFSDLNAQSLRVRSDNAIQIGYSSYKYLTFGIFSGSPNNGQWAIDNWNGGLNFWKPWPSPYAGNYKLFLKDNGNVGIGRNPSYKLDVNGDIAIYGALRLSSDKRLKSEIKPIYSSLSKLSKLNGVSYKKKLPKVKQNNRTLAQNEVSDEVKQKTIAADTISTNANNKLNYGFIAQDLQEIYPELVKKDNEGFLSIDYVSLIPVLVEAVKELQSEINTLKKNDKKNGNTKSSTASKSGSSTNSTDNSMSKILSGAKLYQNNPNPFNTNTKIRYELPNKVNKAFIGIYNLNGNQVKLIELHARGYNSETIRGSELSPGIYIYTLIADGKVIDTKRMILTQ